MSERELDGDRLVAVGLAELAQGRGAPDVRAAVAARLRDGEPARPDRLRRVLRAAVWFWGIVVVVAIARLASAPSQVAQEPEQAKEELPPFVWAESMEHLARIDAGAANLVVSAFSTPDDVQQIERFQLLRSLQILSTPVSSGHEAWKPLAALPLLEELTLHVPNGFSPDDLLPLADAPRLESLSLAGPIRIDAAAVRALARLSRLRSLGLHTVELTADGVRALADMPRLDNLELLQVQCDETTLLGLQVVHRLRSLQLTSMGYQPVVRAVCALHKDWPKAVHEPGPGLTTGLAEVLARLPLFDRLELSSCAVTPEALRVLPANLHALAITRCLDADPEVFSALQGRRSLRSLTLDHFTRHRWLLFDESPRATDGPSPPDPLAGVLPDQTPTITAQARLIESLSLRELRYEGDVPPEVAAAIGKQRELESFGLQDGHPQEGALDLSFLAALPRLRRVRLSQTTQSVDELAQLAQLRGLQRLDLRFENVPASAVQRLLPGVTITFQ